MLSCYADRVNLGTDKIGTKSFILLRKLTVLLSPIMMKLESSVGGYSNICNSISLSNRISLDAKSIEIHTFL